MSLSGACGDGPEERNRIARGAGKGEKCTRAGRKLHGHGESRCVLSPRARESFSALLISENHYSVLQKLLLAEPLEAGISFADLGYLAAAGERGARNDPRPVLPRLADLTYLTSIPRINTFRQLHLPPYFRKPLFRTSELFSPTYRYDSQYPILRFLEHGFLNKRGPHSVYLLRKEQTFLVKWNGYK